MYLLCSNSGLVRYNLCRGFPGVSGGKQSACSAEDLHSIPGEGNGSPVQYFGLEREFYTVHGVAESQSDTTE